MPTPKDPSKSKEFFISGNDKEAIKARVYELLDSYGDSVRDKIKTEKNFKLRYLEDDGEIKVTVHKILRNSFAKLHYSEDGKILISADKDIKTA